MKKIGILGSTGSIGTQTIDVARALKIPVVSLTTNTNIELVEKQAREFNPKIVCVFNNEKSLILKERLSDTDILVTTGMDGLIKAATVSQADTIVTAVVGIIGLTPTVEAIKHKKNIALANKETLVCAGSIVMELAKIHKVKILPVDSEHSAIYQCLQGSNNNELKKILLTASGGPFRGRTSLDNISKQEALKHPNWSMGAKISIDSATLMNKGLEYIEAIHLFNTRNIEVLVHPQSIIHSMVCFNDNSVIAQCGTPDMRIPIQYALTYPNRLPSNAEELDFTLTDLTFEKPDEDTFICLKLAKDSIKKGGNMPCVLNSANEEAVDLFLQDKILFSDIPKAILHALNTVLFIPQITLDDVFTSDKLARLAVKDLFEIN